MVQRHLRADGEGSSPFSSLYRSVLLEQRRAVSEWVDVLPAVQWALNTSFRPRYGSTPYHVMFGRAPRTSFSVLANSSAGEWNCDVLDDDQIKLALKGVLELQEQFHVQVQERVCLLYTSPSPRDKRQSRMPSSA